MLGATIVVYPAISSIAGLAVAQTATQWNNVNDAAKGDALSSGILAMSPYLWNGLTFDRTKGTGGSMNVNTIGVITPADATANPTTLSAMQSFPMVFNTVTWDRVRSPSADGLPQTGILSIGPFAWNGTTFDKFRSASATNNTATTSIGTIQTTPLTTWFTVPNTTSAAATAATISKATGGGTVRHVVTSVTMCFQDSAINTVARLVNLRDGATGAGTIIRSWYLSNGGVAGGAQCENISGLNISGSANTAMTLEFAAAPAATASETVSFAGYSTP
jgi:hypothetical protein